MKLDIDCVRETLLYIESAALCHDISEEEMLENLAEFPQDIAVYACYKLLQRGYITGKITCAGYGSKLALTVWAIQDLTWEGHELLDKLRDDDVWAETKSIASKFKSISIGILSQVATNVITQSLLGR